MLSQVTGDDSKAQSAVACAGSAVGGGGEDLDREKIIRVPPYVFFRIFPKIEKNHKGVPLCIKKFFGPSGRWGGKDSAFPPSAYATVGDIKVMSPTVHVSKCPSAIFASASVERALFFGKRGACTYFLSAGTPALLSAGTTALRKKVECYLHDNFQLRSACTSWVT